MAANEAREVRPGLLLDVCPARGEAEAMTRLSIRICFEPEGAYMGPGMAQLLQGIKEQGSISRAAAAMGMGYRKAWLLIQQMQETFAGQVVTTATGGLAGGGAVLTERGEALLSNYRAVEIHAQKAAASELRTLSAMTARDRAARAPARAPRKTARKKRRAAQSPPA
jgi:molybdate transport system regulatory protein